MLIAFKLKLALACAAGLAGPLAVAPLLHETGPLDAGLRDRQAFVEVQPGTVSYRAAGDFTRAGKQAASPLVTARFETPLTIMKHQTSSADYQRCVEDGGCKPLDRGVVRGGRPARGAGQLARRQCLRCLAVEKDRRELPAADRRGMGVRRRQQVQG